MKLHIWRVRCHWQISAAAFHRDISSFFLKRHCGLLCESGESKCQGFWRSENDVYQRQTLRRVWCCKWGCFCRLLQWKKKTFSNKGLLCSNYIKKTEEKKYKNSLKKYRLTLLIFIPHHLRCWYFVSDPEGKWDTLVLKCSAKFQTTWINQCVKYFWKLQKWPNVEV